MPNVTAYNNLWFIAVVLTKGTQVRQTTSWTHGGTEKDATERAEHFALQAHEGFAVYGVTVTRLAGVSIDRDVYERDRHDALAAAANVPEDEEI